MEAERMEDSTVANLRSAEHGKKQTFVTQINFNLSGDATQGAGESESKNTERNQDKSVPSPKSPASFPDNALKVTQTQKSSEDKKPAKVS